MSEKKETLADKPKKPGFKKSAKSVRFSANIDVNHRGHSEDDDTDESFEDAKDDCSDSSFDSSVDIEEYSRLKTESEELHDVLYDFYHDSKMAGKNANILIGDIDSHPSESISSLVCRVLVNYDKLCEEHRILEEEKSKLDEDKVQLQNSLSKLREQLNDAVDSNIEEIEDLSRENEGLRSEIKTFSGKNSEALAALIQAREDYVNRLKSITELSKVHSSEKLMQQLKNDTLQASIELKEAKELLRKEEDDKTKKLKRVKSLPSTFRQDSLDDSERGGLLSELKTCKNLQESQRKQISKILDEKLALETQVSELKRNIVLLKAERRVNVKTKSKVSQTEQSEEETPVANVEKYSEETNSEMEGLIRRCKELQCKLEQVKREKLTVEREKTSLLLSFDANIEKKDALEEQLAALQEKMTNASEENKAVRNDEKKDAKKVEVAAVCTQTEDSSIDEKSLNETDGGFQKSYKGIFEAKVEIEKIRVQEQDKQIAMLKRENEVVKDKLKKAENVSHTLQSCLKDLTDEKLQLLDSIEELNEEKAELEEARSKLEKEVGGTTREKFVADEVCDIRNKERKVGDSLEANKSKLAQLDLKVVEVLKLVGSEETGSKRSDPKKDVEDMISSLLSMVENLKLTVTAFKTSYEKTKGEYEKTKDESVRTQNELETLNRENTEMQSLVDTLTKQNREIVKSLEESSKSFENKMERIKKEKTRLESDLGKMRESKTGYEKSLAESKRREEDLGRQLKNICTKRDDLQQSFDQLSKKSTEASSALAGATKEIEDIRSKNKKLTDELEQLREDLEGRVEDRDELLELLDRIVCENGTGNEKRNLGQKVERIRKRSKSEDNSSDVEVKDSGSPKRVGSPKLVVCEKLVVSREADIANTALGDSELFEENEKMNGHKGMDELQEENQRLKEMVEKMLTDQKKMEIVLNSLSEANAEIQQGLEESLEHTEQIRLQGSENDRHQDAVDYQVISDENAELRRLHEAMVGTNEALSTNLRRLHDEKTRSERLKTSFQDVTQKNSALEKDVERLTKEKEETEKEMLDLKRKQKDLVREIQKTKNEKLNAESLLEENHGRVKDLKLQIDSLTEINQDLRETNEKLRGSSKESEKKWIKLHDKFDELELENEDLRKAKKRFEKELSEQSKRRSGIELELDQSTEKIKSLEAEISSYTKKGRELEKSLEASERELKTLREIAGQVTKLEQDAQAAGRLRGEMEEVKKTLSEREERIVELENNVSRLKKEIENSQRFVKAVSQENDTLRDSLSEWETEASKIRKHVHQLSQDTVENKKDEEDKSDPKDLDKIRSVKAFEEMQVEMDAINKHLKSMTTDNKELNTKLETLTKENAELTNRNIQLLTRFDIVSKDLEKKTAEIGKLSSKNSDSKSKKISELREKHGKEKNLLQTKIDKLDLENTLLKNSLGNTLDEQKRIAECLEGFVESLKGKTVQKQNTEKRPKDIVGEEWEIRSKISGSTTKPDLIRDSTEVKDEFMIVEQRKYRSKLSAVQSSGTEADTKELLADLLKEQMSLKSYCHEISLVVNEKDLNEDKDAVDDRLDATKAELDKTNELKRDLESSLAKKDEELTKINEEKAKLQSEAATIKEKCDKLQAVFRALILLMNDKKSGEKKSGEEAAEGPTRIIDYIKGMKTKYTTLTSENENLEKKVSDLQKEIEEHKARAKTRERETEETKTVDRNISEDKERILNKLLLASAREKRHLLEKLRELYDEFSKVKSNLEKEAKSKNTNLEKTDEEFSESIMHMERFMQSVAHDRPVTVVADSAAEKDPNLELAKENEELIGRISAIQSSRRREGKNFKDELAKLEEKIEEAVKAEEEKWKEEMEKVKGEYEKKMKEKEQAATELRNSLKIEVSQLKLNIRRLNDEHEATQRNEARVATEKLEEKIKLLKTEMEKKVAEKDLNIAEVKRKADMDVKERARMAEVEISKVRVSWAEAERKLRSAKEEKTDAVRELGRVKVELGEVKGALETAQKQASEREDGFKREQERLQRTISNLEASRSLEASGLERNQARISEFQRSPDEVSRQKQQLESAKRNSERNLGNGVERFRHENSKLQRELQQRRVIVGNERVPDPNVPYKEPNVPYRDSNVPFRDPNVPFKDPNVPNRDPNVLYRDPNVPYSVPSGERVKVMGTVRQPPIEKPQMVIPVESAPGRSTSGDSQRRVKVREGQSTSVRVTRGQDQGMRRGSERDTVTDELDAMFRKLSDSPEWMDDSPTTVIHAKPIQARTQAAPPQRPQPEWETQQDRTWPMQKDPRRYPASNTRQKDPPPPAAARPQPPRPGYYKDEGRQRPPGYPSSKPITRQVQGSLKNTDMTSSVDNHRVVEVKRVRPHSTKHRRPRRSSVGSDNVFLANSSDVASSLTSHGSKTGDFWRSRSLEDLTCDHSSMKHSEHPAAQGHGEKLPNSFSGPRRGEIIPRLTAQGGGSGKGSGAKKVTPLKGMEYV